MLLTAMAAAHAGTERFDYDALGRLVRHIDSSGTITEYAYDAVGNILEVRRSIDSGPPRVSGVSPAALRRGQTLRVTITGNRLAGARVSSSDPELDISGLTSAATAVAFTLGVSPAATLGARVFTASTATGDAIFSLMIDPQVPTLDFSPSPATLTAGGSQTVTFMLSNADTVAHSLTLTSTNTAVATVSPDSISFQAGQTQATGTVTAVASGTAAVTVNSQTLGQTSLGIYVSAPFSGQGAAYAAPVGVLRRAGAAPSGVGPIVAPNVGVVRQSAAAGGNYRVDPLLAPNVGIRRQ
ncbi:Ig-like domain-containing protein [Accumulibacter sp.]|uniref:Ig-like domain-containing protein n=1 Tax=Accumulibacter sp. TaxID=2053492 RepID=UPI0035B083D7